jgi:hypothetical protein
VATERTQVERMQVQAQAHRRSVRPRRDDAIARGAATI